MSRTTDYLNIYPYERESLRALEGGWLKGHIGHLERISIKGSDF